MVDLGTAANPGGNTFNVNGGGTLIQNTSGTAVTAVGDMFENERDAVAILKWKEILDMLEGATDKCKDVATALEGIFVKHA